MSKMQLEELAGVLENIYTLDGRRSAIQNAIESYIILDNEQLEYIMQICLCDYFSILTKYSPESDTDNL